MPILNALTSSRIARPVLVASGDAMFRRLVLETLRGVRLCTLEASGGADALLQLERTGCAGLVLDRRLPDLDAEELADLVSEQYPKLEVELLDSALLAAPPAPLSPALDFRGAIAALRALGPHLVAPAAAGEAEPSPAPTASIALRELLPGLVGRSAHLEDISGLVRLVAPRKTTVLILGETGTGKECIARAIHEASGRAQKPWVVVNCAAIPEALLESELFGFSRGAFTGAMQPRAGRIQAAHGGTLFLDEIGELPLAMQSKLLRFLQEGEVQRLGSNEPQTVDVRVVAATNLDLEAEVEAGRFRRDLYYRLAVFPLELQPLRRRPADVLPLAQHFLARLQAEAGEAAPALTSELVALLERHAWPGNVRELQHAMERAAILAQGQPQLLPEHFPALLRGRATEPARFGPSRAE